MTTATKRRTCSAILRHDLETAVAEARENHTYWRRQAAVRTHPHARAEAADLARVWQYNLKTRQSRLADLQE